MNSELISCIQDLQLELDIENYNDRQRDRDDDLADRAQIQELLKGLHDKQVPLSSSLEIERVYLC